MTALRRRFLLGALGAAGCVGSAGVQGAPGGGFAASSDLATVDLAVPAECLWPEAHDVSNSHVLAPHCGKPFPLHGDDPKSPAVTDNGVERAPDGALRPAGSDIATWSLILPGCFDCGQPYGHLGRTTWRRIEWKADVPSDARLTVRVRTGDAPSPDSSWGAWFELAASPADLGLVGLRPNWDRDAYLQVQFRFSAPGGSAVRLNALRILFECPLCPG